MSVAAKLKQYLDDNRVEYDVLSHTRTYTAQETAQAAQVPGNEVAKSVVVRADDRFVLAVLPAPRKVNLERLKETLGAEDVQIAEESEFRSLFPGCEVGAMPPFGNLYGLDVYVDGSLADDEQIIFNACTHVDAIQMRYKDFERLASAKVATFAASDE
ncbi:MAG TPA: YbaK/EbsC family protein [Candidatus Saccharimonadales bacterium]|nr:YbaK/EbsC family protein [Candidatus Saccharimonadales bacterium]